MLGGVSLELGTGRPWNLLALPLMDRAWNWWCWPMGRGFSLLGAPLLFLYSHGGSLERTFSGLSFLSSFSNILLPMAPFLSFKGGREGMGREVVLGSESKDIST